MFPAIKAWYLALSKGARVFVTLYVTGGVLSGIRAVNITRNHPRGRVGYIVKETLLSVASFVNPGRTPEQQEKLEQFGKYVIKLDTNEKGATKAQFDTLVRNAKQAGIIPPNSHVTVMVGTTVSEEQQ